MDKGDTLCPDCHAGYRSGQEETIWYSYIGVAAPVVSGNGLPIVYIEPDINMPYDSKPVSINHACPGLISSEFRILSRGLK